jgi:hypothetical protein
MSLDFIIEFDIINPFNTSTPLTLILILEMFWISINCVNVISYCAVNENLESDFGLKTKL